MAHTLASDKAQGNRSIEEPDICIIDPDQEEDIARHRAALRLKQRKIMSALLVTYPMSSLFSRKRSRPSYVVHIEKHSRFHLSILHVYYRLQNLY